MKIIIFSIAVLFLAAGAAVTPVQAEPGGCGGISGKHGRCLVVAWGPRAHGSCRYV
jgi:hypothetical protein